MSDTSWCRPLSTLPFALLCAVAASACGPRTEALHARHVDGCSVEHRFTAVLSGNVLAFTVARDSPGEVNDAIITVLSYKETSPGSREFALVPPLEQDPLQVSDQAPAMTASVDGSRACLAPFGEGDHAGDVCLASWLKEPRCYELEPD
jgi:hypothetical protein